jgi:hypothetical protein
VGTANTAWASFARLASATLSERLLEAARAAGEPAETAQVTDKP